jgi:ubiquinol-cytochrome c reductase cytochrome c1 subunit
MGPHMINVSSPVRRTAWVTVLLVAGLGLGASIAGASGSAPVAHADVDVGNVASLQRGARNFVNYCMGCHSAQYVRYNTLAADLQITEKQLIDNLMFAAEKPQETMTIAMRPADATRWFGTAAPDLSLIARNRGVDYLYSFLRGFYLDPARPTGVNNLVLPNAAMPHVLADLQGMREAVFVEEAVEGGQKHTVFKEFRQLAPGKLSAEEYDQFVRDIVTFLAYIGEPMQLQRQRLGMMVIAFLIVFGILAYLLKQEFWKDVT